MIDPFTFAKNMLSQNPNVANNANAKNMIDAITSNDAKRGEEIANNLCKTYGVSKEQAVQQAMKFFGLQ